MNPYMNQFMPNGFEDANQQAISPASQQQYFNQQLGQSGQMSQPTSRGANLGGLNPLAMAMMLRRGNSNVTIPSTDSPQMTGVAGMGESMGTGLTGGSIGFNPYASGSYGIKY